MEKPTPYLLLFKIIISLRFRVCIRVDYKCI